MHEQPQVLKAIAFKPLPRPKDVVFISNKKDRFLSLLELGHRAGDAVVRSTELAGKVEEAFQKLNQEHDAIMLAKLSPTSLVFGVWDSRGTQVKRPRLIRSVIRAEDVQVLHTAAQYSSSWKKFDEGTQAELRKAAGPVKKGQKNPLSKVGFSDNPPDGSELGGIVANGPIYRQTTINLIALRSLHGADNESTGKLRRYLLGLSLVAATADMELYLREGCLLRYSDDNDEWRAVRRRGKPEEYSLSSKESQQAILAFAKSAASEFGVDREEKIYEFDIKKAKQLLAKKDTSGEEE